MPTLQNPWMKAWKGKICFQKNKFQTEKAKSFKERIDNNYAELGSAQKPKILTEDQSMQNKRRSYSTTDSSGKVQQYHENMNSRLNAITIKPKK